MAEHRKQLTVLILEAKGLTKTADKQVNPSSYCLVSCNSAHFRTNTQQSTVKPEWKQRFSFNDKDIQDPESQLIISVWSYDKYSSDAFLGQVAIALSSLPPNVPSKQWYDLQERGDDNEKVKGKIFIEVVLSTEASGINRKKSIDAIKRKLSISVGESKPEIKKKPSSPDLEPLPEAVQVPEPTQPRHLAPEDMGSGTEAEMYEATGPVERGLEGSDSEGDQPAGTEPLSDSLTLKSKLEALAEQEDTTSKEEHSAAAEEAPAPKRAKKAATKDFGDPTKKKRRKRAKTNPANDAAAVGTTPDAVAAPGGKKAKSKPVVTDQADESSGEKQLATTSTAATAAAAATAPAPQPQGQDREKMKKQPSFFQIVKGLFKRDHSTSKASLHAKDGVTKETGAITDAEGDGKTRDRSFSKSEADGPAAGVGASHTDTELLTGPNPTRNRSSSTTPSITDPDFGQKRRRKKHGKTHDGDSSDDEENSVLAQRFSEKSTVTPRKQPSASKLQASVVALAAGAATASDPNHSRLLAIEASLEFTSHNHFVLSNDPERQFIKEGNFQLVGDATTTTPAEKDAPITPRLVVAHAFLFSDLLLICKPIDTSSGPRYIPLARIKLERLFLVDSAVDSSLVTATKRAAVQLELVETSVSIKTAVFGSPEEKAEWMQAISSALNLCQLTYTDNEKPFLYKVLLYNEHKESGPSSPQEESANSRWGRTKSLESLQRNTVTTASPTASPRNTTTPGRDRKNSQDFKTVIDDVTKQRDKFKSDLESFQQQLDAKEKTISELKQTVEEMRAELKNSKRKDPPPSLTPAQLEAQLSREILAKESAEKKAMEYMTKFLDLSSAFSKKQQQDSAVTARLTSLESEMTKMRGVKPPPPSAMKKSGGFGGTTPPSIGALSSPSPAPAGPSATTSASPTPSGDSTGSSAGGMNEYFDRQLRAFEELFTRGRFELQEVINQGKKDFARYRDDAVTDSEAPTDSDMPGSSINIRRKSKGRKRRADSTTDEFSLLKAENDLLKRENKVLNQELTLLSKTSQKPSIFEKATPTTSPTDANDTTESSATLMTTSGGNSASSLSASTTAQTAALASQNTNTSDKTLDSTNSDDTPGAGTNAAPGTSTVAVVAQTGGGNTPPTNPTPSGKSKKLRAVRFGSEQSGDESAGGRGKNWRNVAEKLGLKKKKEAPATGQPWRKPPAATPEGPMQVKRQNRLDFRGEQSYWSDDLDSDTYGVHSALSGNEAGQVPGRNSFAAYNSDYTSESDEAGK